MKHDASAIAERADAKRASESEPARHPLAKEQRQSEIYTGGWQGLGAHDLKRIAKRQALAEVVIQCPCGTRTGDSEHAQCVSAMERSRLPRKTGCGSQNQRRTHGFAAHQVVAKQTGRERNGERRLEIQEQR